MEGASQIKEDKTHKDTIDWLGLKMDPNYGIPRLCHCGEDLTEVVYQEHCQDTCPGKRFIVCTQYKERGGPHVRRPWVFAVAEELERRQRRLEAIEMDMKPAVLKLREEMNAIREEVSHLRYMVANLSTRVQLLEDSSSGSD